MLGVDVVAESLRPMESSALGMAASLWRGRKTAAGLRNSQGTEWPTTQRGPASHQRFAEQAHSDSGLPSGNRGIPGVGYLSHCASALTVGISAISASTDAIAGSRHDRLQSNFAMENRAGGEQHYIRVERLRDEDRHP